MNRGITFMAHTVYSCVAYVPFKITTITRLVHSLMHLQLGELYIYITPPALTGLSSCVFLV